MFQDQGLSEWLFFQIDYYQLKHSTAQLDTTFKLSHFKKTLEGFASRFIQHKKQASHIFFSIITNRKIDDSFKKNLESVIKGNNVDAKFKKTIEKYTFKKKRKPEVTLLKVIGGRHDYPNDINVYLEAWAFFKRQM